MRGIQREGPLAIIWGHLTTTEQRETMNRRHDPTPDCDGTPFVAARIADRNGNLIPAGGSRCPECEQDLCPCELGYGHDCEA
jgi:hypothetical protein